MAKKTSPLLDYLVYLAVRLVICVIQALPVETGCSAARMLAWIVYRIDRRHRRVALENLQKAFGAEMSEIERDAAVRKVYEHFCRLLVEIAYLPRYVHVTNWRRYIDPKGGRRLVENLLTGRPLLLVSGHFGNWEMAGYSLGLLGFQLYPVARPLDNPYLDAFLRRFRERNGQKILAKHGDFELMQHILAKGGVVAMLADQDAGQRGLFVDFFGRPASTHKAIALLALQYQVPILVGTAQSLDQPLHYVLNTAETIRPEDYAERPDAVSAMTQQFTRLLEEAIRQAPTQYFWLHRRWKHQPRAKKDRRAA